MLFGCSCRATEWPFWFGLILPFVVIYIFNAVCFVVILIRIFEKKPESSQSVMSKLKENLIVGIVLGLLFGPGWGFGLASTSSDETEVTFFFQLLFCMFAGSQGVLFFIVFGMCSKQFRQFWRKKLCFRSQTHAVIQVKQFKPLEKLEQNNKECYTKTQDVLQPPK